MRRRSREIFRLKEEGRGGKESRGFLSEVRGGAEMKGGNINRRKEEKGGRSEVAEL